MTDIDVKDPNVCKKPLELINETLPDSNTDWLTEDLEINGSPDIAWYLNLEVCVSVAGVLSVSRSRNGKIWTEKQNAGESLAAGASYRFTVDVSGGDAINLSYSTTSGTISKLRICEVV